MRRSRYEILAQILGFCIRERRITSIMCRNSLRSEQLKDHLSLLTSRRLLAHNSGMYVTTRKGRCFLEAFTHLKELMEEDMFKGVSRRLISSKSPSAVFMLQRRLDLKEREKV